MDRAPNAFLALFAFILGGCSPQASISGRFIREAPLGIEPGETIAVLIDVNIGPDGQRPIDADTQRSVDICIRDGMYRVNRQLSLSQATDPRVRHLVNVQVESTRSQKRLGRDSHGTSVSWTETTTFHGTIFDKKYERRAARLVGSAHSEEERGFAGGLVGGVVPLLFPYAASFPTEKKACERFGEELARLVTDASPIEAKTRRWTESLPGSTRPTYSPQVEAPKDGSMPSEDFVNCVSGGVRKWTYESRCD